jgi:hypothetical protein
VGGISVYRVPNLIAPEGRNDRPGSWIPTWRMITTRFIELRKRRGLMIAPIAVNIGIPVAFLAGASFPTPWTLRPTVRQGAIPSSPPWSPA